MITVFILHWNRPRECAASVRRFLEQDTKVSPCVIDNGSTAENRRQLAEQLPEGVAVKSLATNHGWGGALNKALRDWLRSGDELCLVSAHDALPEAGCVRRLVDAMTADRRLGMACAEFGDGDVLRFSPWRGIYVANARRQPDGSLEYMPAPHGTLMMLRRDCLEEAGLFDERYFAYGDETEIGLRAGLRGWRSAMVWGAVVSNPGTWSPRPVVSYLFARNTLLTIRTYGGPAHAWARLLLKCATFGRDQHGLFAAWPIVAARWRGMLDFCRGRLGAPPPHLLADTGQPRA